MKSLVILILVTFSLSVHSTILKKFSQISYAPVPRPPAPPSNVQADDVQQNDVNYYLYLSNSPNTPVEINRLCRGCMVKLIIHGWLESANKSWYRNMTLEYFKQGYYNIVHVDWSKPASAMYPVASNSVKMVGSLIGKFILNLNTEYGIPLRNVHIIGHSLGAHVSGHAGKEVFKMSGKKVYRISALDPASPFFEIPLVQGLSKTDAAVVDVIHTDAGGFGYSSPLGHVDYFPNGGRASQPGCPVGIDIISIFDVQATLENLYCSHTRSYVYFIKSINEVKYLASKCETWELYTQDACSNNTQILMGDGYVFDPKIKGKFFCYTSEQLQVSHNLV